MKIYIASSWKNQHGVELLTEKLRESGHEVCSWIENNFGEHHNHVTKKLNFDEWVNSKESDQSYHFDRRGATTCDLFIYYAPAGNDACVEMGMAYSCGIKIFGLWAKGEPLGLMRKAVNKWFGRVNELLGEIEYLKSINHKNINNL